MDRFERRAVRVEIAPTIADDPKRFEITVQSSIGKQSYTADVRRVVGFHASTGVGNDVPHIRPGGKRKRFRSGDAALLAGMKAVISIAARSDGPPATEDSAEPHRPEGDQDARSATPHP